MLNRSAQREGHPPDPADQEGTSGVVEMRGAEESGQERNDPEAPE